MASVTVPAGHRLVVTVTITNSGGQPGSYSLTGQLLLHGTSTVEAHLSTATGTVGPGQSAQAQIESLGALAYGDEIAGYNPSMGLDLVLQLTDTSTGAQASAVYPSAVFLQVQPPVTVPTQAPSITWYTNAGNVVVVVSGAGAGQDYQLEHVDAYGNPLGLLGENPTGIFLLSGAPGYGIHVAARICDSAGCGPWSPPVFVVFPGAYAPPPAYVPPSAPAPASSPSTGSSSPPQPITTPGRFVPSAFEVSLD